MKGVFMGGGGYLGGYLGGYFCQVSVPISAHMFAWTPPAIGRASPSDGGLDLGPFFKTFLWKSLTKNKGTACIYQDVLVMGSIYVIISRFYEDYWEILGTLGIG